MKLSAQEEYGLRCLLHLAKRGDRASLTIPEISAAEGLSIPNVAKLMRLMRMGKLVQSVRGQAGGYTLARPAGEIKVTEVMEVLGGRFFGPQFCGRHSGRQDVCCHHTDCSLRALWNSIQFVLQSVLGRTTLSDLLMSEDDVATLVSERTSNILPLLEQSRRAAQAMEIHHP
ncbi:MAG: Rrf2 family transcriptional regulator [Bryobacterales bacterium]|nr:Rrf2 family transcriptional regulator [Bryobacterales bacterium]